MAAEPIAEQGAGSLTETELAAGVPAKPTAPTTGVPAEPIELATGVPAKSAEAATGVPAGSTEPATGVPAKLAEAATAVAAEPIEPTAPLPAGSIAEPNREPNREPSTDPASGPSADSTGKPPARVRFQVLTGGRAAGAPAEPEPPLTVDDDSATEGADIGAPPADFRVRCPDCGPQYVAVADVRFVSTGGGADTDRYLFTCPACGVRVRRPAGPELARILRSSGVATLALRRGPDQAL